jgi:catechol 2,3-dioxygenase-like lactoylglutathione lyase family enzyme
LSDYRVDAAVAVSDLERAREFYDRKLGLSAEGDDPDGGRTSACGAGRASTCFPRQTPARRAPPSPGQVEDIERVVDELTEGRRVRALRRAAADHGRAGYRCAGRRHGRLVQGPRGNLAELVQRLLGFAVAPDELATPAALAVRHCLDVGHTRVALVINDEVKEDFAELEETGSAPARS